MFTLSGALSWVGKCTNSTPTHLCCQKAGDWSPKPSPNDALKLGDPDIPVHVCLHHHHLGFCNYDGTPQEERLQSANEHLKEPRHTCRTLHHDWVSQHSQRQWDLGMAAPPTPSPSWDCGFDSDVSSVSTSLLVSLHSSRSGGSRWSHHGWCCRKIRGCMKDIITYQSWHWDLMVYHHAGC